MPLKIVNLKSSGLYPKGVITTQDVYDAKTKSLVKGGMFCPELFGEEAEWQALRSEKGKFPISARADKLAKICLSKPVTVVGVERFATYTGLSQEDALNVIDGNRLVKRCVGEGKLDIVTYSEASASGEDAEIFAGGNAVRAFIESVDKEALKNGTAEQRGLYAELDRTGENPFDWVVDEVVLLPPEFRPIFERNGKHYLHVMNESYRKVVSRSNRLKRVMELDAPRLIVWNEIKLLQRAVNELIGGLNGETDPERCTFFFKEQAKEQRFIGLVNVARLAKKSGIDGDILEMLLYAAFRKEVK